jgi:hypothetical protein
MRLASDGKPFDIDNLGRPTYDNEVEIIQYLRPNGKRRRMTCPAPNYILAKVAGMIIEAEEIRTGEIAIWVRGKNEPEENQILEVAINGPGENGTTEVLFRLIERKFGQLIGDKE